MSNGNCEWWAGGYLYEQPGGHACIFCLSSATTRHPKACSFSQPPVQFRSHDMAGRSHRPPPESASGNWSDGETSTLIDAWGPVHLRRRPRGLLLTDWRAAASAVNAHRAAAGRRFNRTRVQCQTRVRTLKKRYKTELPKQPPSGWRHLPRLHAFLASPDDSPPGFPATAPETVVKQEVKEEEVVAGGGGIGLAASWTVPRRPRNAAAGTGFCPGAVVTKLAEVYERVELAKIGAEKVKMEMEMQQEMANVQKAMFDAVKMEQ